MVSKTAPISDLENHTIEGKIKLMPPLEVFQRTAKERKKKYNSPHFRQLANLHGHRAFFFFFLHTHYFNEIWVSRVWNILEEAMVYIKNARKPSS